MITELNIAGIFVAPIVGHAAAAFVLFLILRWLLAKVGFWRAVWHPALFETALFLSLLSALVLL